MFVNHIDDIPRIIINPSGAEGVEKQILIGPAEGWKGWVMRLFSLQTGGRTPRHNHPWPHINYIISGTGVLFLAGQDYPVKPGSMAYVPGNAEHQFMNNGDEEFSFICIVPEEGDR